MKADRAEMRAEQSAIKADMKADRSEMKADMKAERADMKAEIELMKEKAKQDYLQLETDLKSSVSKSVRDVEGKVKTRIDAEFDDKNIHRLVEVTAKEHIDKVADNIIGQQIDKKISPKLDVVDKRLKELTIDIEFDSVLVAAKNDDYYAYEQLNNWSNDKSYPLRVKAQQALRGMNSGAVYLVAEEPYPWKPGIDPSKLTMVELRKEFRSAERAGNKRSLLEYLVERKDIAKKEKLDFLNEVEKTDQSLTVRGAAQQYIDKLSKENLTH
jgi:hypothetical protein